MWGWGVCKECFFIFVEFHIYLNLSLYFKPKSLSIKNTFLKRDGLEIPWKIWCFHNMYVNIPNVYLAFCTRLLTILYSNSISVVLFGPKNYTMVNGLAHTTFLSNNIYIILNKMFSYFKHTVFVCHRSCRFWYQK